MRIAMFTNTYSPLVGGIERSIATFTADLSADGHSVLVVTPQVRGAPTSDKQVFRLPAIPNVAGTAFSLQLPFAPGLREHLDAFQPEVIHTHQPFLLGETGLREARRRRIPLVFTHHTFYERYADLFGFPREVGARIARRLSVEYANRCDRVIAPTHSVAAILQNRGVEKAIRVLPTGVNLEQFAGDRHRVRRELGIPACAKVIGHLGRLIAAKNMAFLSEAVAEALLEEPDCWALWVGHGDSVADIQRIFGDRGVAGRLIMPGVWRGTAVADAYAAMDVFVFSSKTDTQGIVLVESLASGTPVVALDTPGPRDIVRHDLDGLLLPPDTSPGAFAKVVTALLSDTDRLQKYAANARTRSLDFEHGSCARQLADLYREVHVAHQASLNGGGTRRRQQWGLFREKASPH